MSSKSAANKKKPEPASLKKNQKAPAEASSPKKQQSTSQLQPKPEEQQLNSEPEPQLQQSQLQQSQLQPQPQSQAHPQAQSQVHAPGTVEGNQERQEHAPKEVHQPVEHRNQNSSPPVEDEEDNDVPADKDKLVEFLKRKLNKAEMTMSTLFVAIQIEKDKRGKLVKEIEDKKEEINQISSFEDNFLGEKVQDKMTTALKRALEDKVLADEEIAGADTKIDELERQIQELDEKIRNVHKEKYQKEIDADEAQYKVNEQESVVDNFNEEIGKLTTQNDEKDRVIAELNDEINDMKGVVETLIAVRAKLNYYISDDTPSQSRENMRNIATPQEGGFTDMATREGYISEERERGGFTKTEKSRQQPKDDDFWYSEPMRKGVTETKKGGYNDPIPWQPKVQQNYDTLNDRDRGFMTRTPEYSGGMSAVRLPSISGNNTNPGLQHNAKQEYLYKSKEYLDEFGQKNVKKNQAQYKKK